MAAPTFHVRELQWTPEHVRRFWAFLAHSPHAAAAYFSSHSGDALIELVERRVPLAKGQRVLDWGCGPGFLLEKLCARGIEAAGLEFSADSMCQAIERCSRLPSFSGVTAVDRIPTAIPEASFDVVFLVEVIEHLLPEQIDSTLEEINRLLKPGGVVVISTPHNENLAAANTVCPDCGLVFHPWQHVGSFTARALEQLAGSRGFSGVFCAATTIGARSPLVVRALRQLLRRKAPQPHLVYIGRRK